MHSTQLGHRAVLMPERTGFTICLTDTPTLCIHVCSKETVMGATQTEQLRMVAEGLILTDAHKHILAHRLTRKLAARLSGTITVSEMLEFIDNAMCDLQPATEVLEINEDSYRDNRVVKLA